MRRSVPRYTARAWGMWAVLVTCLLSTVAAPVAAQEQTPTAAPEADSDCAPPSRPYRLYAAAELGLVMPVGVGAMLAFPRDDRVRFAVDFFWEPSNYLQSYGIGVAYHPWDRAFFVGGRVRFMQLHPPWSRGFHARRDNQLALGPELGVRLPLDRRQRFLPFASLGATFFPSATSSLPPIYTLDVGFAFGAILSR